MGVVIVGNSSAARECYWLLREAQKADGTVPAFKGFLAWKGYAGNLRELAPFELGDSESYCPAPDDLFVIGMGRASLRMDVYEQLTARGVRWYTLRHPATYICPSAEVGEANIFQRDCVVLANASVGSANFFNGGVTIGHDAVIGDGNVMNLHTGISGCARIGSANQFAPQCIVLEKVVIGSCNVFAPGTTVYKGCRDHCLMAGNPGLVEQHLAEDDATC